MFGSVAGLQFADVSFIITAVAVSSPKHFEV